MWIPFVSRIKNPQNKLAVRRILERAMRSERLEIVYERFRS